MVEAAEIIPDKMVVMVVLEVVLQDMEHPDNRAMEHPAKETVEDLQIVETQAQTQVVVVEGQAVLVIIVFKTLTVSWPAVSGWLTLYQVLL